MIIFKKIFFTIFEQKTSTLIIEISKILTSVSIFDDKENTVCPTMPGTSKNKSLWSKGLSRTASFSGFSRKKSKKKERHQSGKK